LQPVDAPHISGVMNTANFTLFRERLAEACKLRNTTPDKLARSIGLGSRRAIDLEYLGLKCLDIYRLAQIADRLGVSVDWLLGRTSVMALPASAAA
jgi:hypothetical protein